MSLENAAHSIALEFVSDETLGGTPKQRAEALSAAALSLFPSPAWRKLPAFPAPLNPSDPDSPGWKPSIGVLRGSTVYNGKLHISTGGQNTKDAQCWRWNGENWAIQSWFNNLRMNFLTVSPQNDLIMGLGSQHVSGAAKVWKYPENGGNSQIGGNFSGADISYSECWHEGELYVGTMTEDTPGAARLKKWNGTAWVDVFAPGINGLPSSYSYAGIYVTWEFGGKIHVGTMSRTTGHAHVLRLDETGWTNLGGIPGATFTLAAIEYEGKMVVAWEGAGANHPVRYFENGQWKKLGNTPSGWGGATIFNHLANFKGKLMVGVGGPPGKTSVWQLDGENWTRNAGGGEFGSWTGAFNPSAPAEWIYRLQECDGKLYILGAGSNQSCQVWELTDPA